MESGVGTEPVSPAEKESLLVVLSILEDRIATLEVALNKHCGRLDPVLVPPSTNTPGTVAQDRISAPSIAPAVLRVFDSMYKLDDMLDQLARTDGRLRI